MNIEQAKAISIVKILEAINIKPTRKTEREAWYLSPLRNEKTASFKVHTKRNLWYDFGLGIGGDSVKLVCSYLESRKQPCTVSDALKWIEQSFKSDAIAVFETTTESNDVDNEPKLVLKSVLPIRHRALVHYLEARGIPLTIADRVLKEVRFKNIQTGKNMFALGLQNEDDGYEVRNSLFKGCIGSKDITFLRGKEPKPDSLNVFEGFMDYLSVLTQQEGRPFKDDSIILNSLSCIKKAEAYIKGYGYTVAFTWLDNDEPGKKATQLLEEFFKTEEGLQHKPMNGRYKPFKDVNAHHMHTLGL